MPYKRKQGELREATAWDFVSNRHNGDCYFSGLRLVLPELNHYRQQLLAIVASLSGIPIQVDFIQGSWQAYGPRLEMRNIGATLPKGNLRIERLTLERDVWQSLLHWRWQFRDLTFHQFQLDLNVILGGDGHQANCGTTAHRSY